MSQYMEFRHDFQRFRALKLYPHNGFFSICMTVGKVDSSASDMKRWLSGDRKMAYAREIAASHGREVWRYDLTKEKAGIEVKNWRKRCATEHLTEVIDNVT